MVELVNVSFGVSTETNMDTGEIWQKVTDINGQVLTSVMRTKDQHIANALEELGWCSPEKVKDMVRAAMARAQRRGEVDPYQYIADVLCIDDRQVAKKLFYEAAYGVPSLR